MRMPVLFVGHGNPMNAIERNEFHENWAALGERLPSAGSDPLHLGPLGNPECVRDGDRNAGDDP